MVPLLVDEDFTGPLLAALLTQYPGIDAVRVQDAGLRSSDDTIILESAARSGRVVLTHDKDTMIAGAKQRIQQQFVMPGLIAVAKYGVLRELIDDIALLSLYQDPLDCQDRIFYVPLR